MSRVVSFRLNAKEIDRLVQLCSRLERSNIKGVTWIKVHGHKMTRREDGKLCASKSESCGLEIQFCSADATFIYYNWGAAAPLPSPAATSMDRLVDESREELMFNFDQLKLKEWLFRKSVNPIDLLAVYDEAKGKLTYRMRMMVPRDIYDIEGNVSTETKLQVLKMVEDFKQPQPVLQQQGKWMKLPRKIPSGLSPCKASLTNILLSVWRWKSVRTTVRSKRKDTIFVDAAPSADEMMAAAKVRAVNMGKYLRLQLSRSRGLRVCRPLATSSASSAPSDGGAVSTLSTAISALTISPSPMAGGDAAQVQVQKCKKRGGRRKHAFFYDKIGLVNGLCLTIPPPIVGESGVRGGVRGMASEVDIAMGKRGLLYFYAPSAPSAASRVQSSGLLEEGSSVTDSISLLIVHPFSVPK